MTESISHLKRNTIILSIASTSLLLILKLVIGIASGTISIISEAIHSASDLLASLITFLAITKSTTSPDKNHHYGHGKFENLSGAAEAMFIIAAALWIIYEACQKYSIVTLPSYIDYGMMAMIVSIIANYFVSARITTVAKKTYSPALEADALHLRADMWTSVGILLSLFFIKITGCLWIDPTIAIIVGLVILRSGYKIIKKNILELTDISLSLEEEQLIFEIVNNHTQVLSLYRLRTRQSGCCRIIDMRLILDKNMPLDKAHAICEQLESKIRLHFGICDVMIHLEPSATSESHVNLVIEKNTLPI
ncbi:cation diffusion facilitator family transporter [Dendrosporobacter sp. 1207_IL3150]|uniref:cation diffusion facilitator family transporter n=1 Tax=Dendrosporobacter sp. 1207_IL3150 TaxID=3084054 RepID=UPI002FDA99E6